MPNPDLFCGVAPNWSFNVDAKMGHDDAEGMAHVGALRASRSGAS